MKKIYNLLLILLFLIGLVGCAGKAQNTAEKDIYILYTNDVHCGVDDNIGYESLSLIKSTLSNAGKVILVDDGDYIQGDVIGTISKGEYIIDIMNATGYDVATLGNHEFDYGVEQLEKLVSEADFDVVSCNFLDASGNAVFDPYTIVEADGVKIAFIGITAPETYTSSNPKNFIDDNGEFIYSFAQGEDGKLFYETVQKSVNAAKKDGADYVIALSHLGTSMECSPYTSYETIQNVSGISVYLDGHSHSLIEGEILKDKDGKEVLLSSTKTKMEYVGLLTLHVDGTMDTVLLDNDAVRSYVKDIKAEFEDELNATVATSLADLRISNLDGKRLVRNQETNLGDLVADAYRAYYNADIGLANGGGIRTDLGDGEITYGKMMKVHPFGNEICLVECSGQEILDFLEVSYDKMPNENGGFMQVSGIEVTVDLSIPSPVKRDENNFATVFEGERRIIEVKVNGEELDPERTYTVAGSFYSLIEKGDGNTMLCNSVILQNDQIIDVDVLAKYIIEDLDGSIGEEYKDINGQGRIISR